MPAATVPDTAPYDTAPYDALAYLYTYPTPTFPAEAAHAIATVTAICPDAGTFLVPLSEFLAGAELSACEELYVRTFELNPVCALEVGWQVYGEQYARGAFLVKMQELSRDAGVPPGTELADHLPNVLRVLGRSEVETANKLARKFTQPAIDKMRDRMSSDHCGPYRGLLTATAVFLERRYGVGVTSE